MKRIETQLTIEADIQTVWRTMTQIENYPKWNPFIISIHSNKNPPVVNTSMDFTVRWKDGSTQKTREIVNLFVPPQLKDGEYKAVWSYYFKSFISTIGMIRATRTQVLSSNQTGTTHYHTFEEFRGWGTAFLPEDNIKDGFERQAQALKQYCEQKI